MKHTPGKVTIWEESVVIPTYAVGQPDRNPMFLEKRVYQGSTGKVYPYPVIDKIYDDKEDKEYPAVFLENDYLKIMILPSLGGRIQRAYDKTNDYDFVYYNEVMKPALVGLLGPWVSGGIEFNWPQHHRPTTFMPVDYTLQELDDGSKCLKISEVDQMYGTKGMASFVLHPDKAYLEIRGQLYNRTNFPQTFLWWANPAVAVNDHTQSIFPPDVHAVMDHGKRDVSNFPIATGVYYKHDYGPGVDISRYKNLPVPTSYMAYHSDYDFVGGYDYQLDAGIMHVADHHISPGKKQWTWGCGDFGKAWDRNLTDENGPYIELMTGVFTDNQPDFTWLAPYEEKTFTQYFMPYKKVRNIKNATKDLLVNFEQEDDCAYLGIYASSLFDDVEVKVTSGEKVLLSKSCSLSPTKVFETSLDLGGTFFSLCRLSVYDSDGVLLITYQPKEPVIEKMPDPAPEAEAPEDIKSCEELYLVGQHLEQYRHATYNPADYYREGLSRDPSDSRLNNAYGLYLLRNGQIAESEQYFTKAIERLTWLSPNPYDGEPYLNLGFSLLYQGKDDKAYDAFYKATWNAGQQASAFYQLACIASKRGAYEEAYEFVTRALVSNSRNIKARALSASLMIKMGNLQKAKTSLLENLEVDPFDYCSRYLLASVFNSGKEELMTLMQDRLSSFVESSIDFAHAGLFAYAFELLSWCRSNAPMHAYYLAFYAHALDKDDICAEYLHKGSKASPLHCFPNRIEDMLVLEFVQKHSPKDGYAPYYLGNLLYDKKQFTRARQCWEVSSKLIPKFPTVWRNLSLAYFNKEGKPEMALQAMEKAFSLDESDARVFYELDQLHKILGQSPQERLDFYDHFPKLWPLRDDLYTEYVSLLNLLGESSRAYSLIMAHQFHPWEGGEGKVTAQYATSLKLMALEDLAENPKHAKVLLEQALQFPYNLGEGKLEGAKDNDIHYLIGLCEEAMGNTEKAKAAFELATVKNPDPAGIMYYNDQPADMILYEGLALRKLGKNDEAMARFHKLVGYGEKHYYDAVTIDYFAVSLPELQLFDVDLSPRNRIHCTYLIALGSIGLGDFAKGDKLLAEILASESNHFGAAFHQRVYRSLI